MSTLTDAERDRLKTVIVDALNASRGIFGQSAGISMLGAAIGVGCGQYADVVFDADDLAERLHDAIAGPLLARIAKLEDREVRAFAREDRAFARMAILEADLKSIGAICGSRVELDPRWQ